MSSVEYLRTLLSEDAVAGRVIRDLSALEERLGMILQRYFAAQERYNEFDDVFLARLSLVGKINILRAMKLPTKMASRDQAVTWLNKLRILRNILAHGSYVSEDDIKRVASENELREMLMTYPASYRKRIQLIKNWIERLYVSYLSPRQRAARITVYENVLARESARLNRRQRGRRR
jgi:hypothetical protein